MNIMCLNSQRFKTHFVELSLGLIEQVMLFPIFKIYTGPPRICPLLDHNTSVLLVNAFVRSRLDYCNSRLQLVQNSFCRVITHSSKYSHITSQLKKKSLSNIGYNSKIGLITYKILNQGQPVYLRELINPHPSSRITRRSTPKLKFLHTPTFNRKVHKLVKLFSNFFSL